MTGQGSQKVTLQETISRYQQLRRAAHQFAEEEFKHFGIQLRDINYSDAVKGDAWRSQWGDQQKVPSWSWTDMYNDYRSNAGAKRFDAALIVNGGLCGLCYGVPTKEKITLRIHGISRKPTNNPIAGNVFRIMIFAAIAYARILKCKEIWIVQPMNAYLVSMYQKSGFTPCIDRSGITTHLTMVVNYD